MELDTLKQNKELSESIKYASYIQNALLPESGAISRILPDHFLFYKPKDIVSGDFYWIYKKKDEILIAVADCTGHGVPGAFMSILGISFLNEVVIRDQYSTTGSILNQFREYIMKSLNQTGEENEQKDGIDIALCKINTASRVMEFSGAFNPVYIITESRLIDIQGDKMPIGIAADEERSFSTHNFKLNSGDTVYLFSDGYVDQFGGPDEKKFKYKPFRELLLKISKLPLKKQKDALESTFYKWKGDLPQLDDLLVFGFKI